ncbi:MAG: hypothetical protein ABIS38_00445 [Sphingomicrobium sp.]
MRRLTFIATAALLCAACGEQKQAADNGFMINFKKEFGQSCEAAASRRAGAEIARKYCGCALDKLVAKYRPTELAGLTPDKVQPIMTQCAKDVGVE